MAEMGDGYGSEFHLLRYLGRHREELDRSILQKTGGDRIHWRDFRFDSSRAFGDRELEGLDFLEADSPTRIAWAKFWPSLGTPPNWDAIGRIERDGAMEWLLVEAKANTEEIESSCGAGKKGRGQEGLERIREAVSLAKLTLGIAPDRDWLNGYYQSANRLTVLYFLRREGVPARLLFIYFTGDQNRGRTCPADEAGWTEPLARQDRHLGIDGGHRLQDRVHKLFLPANRGVGRRKREVVL